jgi:hypothetical protein
MQNDELFYTSCTAENYPPCKVSGFLHVWIILNELILLLLNLIL